MFVGFEFASQSALKKSFISRKKFLIFVLGMAVANLNKKLLIFLSSLRNNTFFFHFTNLRSPNVNPHFGYLVFLHILFSPGLMSL